MRGCARNTHTVSRERKTRRFISLFITSLRSINIDGHIVDPLSLNTRESCVFVTRTLNYIFDQSFSECLLQISRHNRNLAPQIWMDISFWLYIYAFVCTKLFFSSYNYSGSFETRVIVFAGREPITTRAFLHCHRRWWSFAILVCDFSRPDTVASGG